MYGVTCDTYWQMFKAQDGRCGACGKRQQKPALVLDHDHDPPYEVRGLLCAHCNRALTEALVRYVMDPPARRIGPFLVPPERAKVAEEHREDVRRRAKAKRTKSRTNNGPDQTSDFHARTRAALEATKQGGA